MQAVSTNVGKARVLVLALALLAMLAVGVGRAEAASFTWTASCGSGDYYDTGSLGASARVLQASSQCGVRARALCQSYTGATRWETAPTWKFLGQVSTEYCSSPYNHARLNLSVLIGG